jgi:uncharacterized protein (TIGR00730 family)
LRKLNRLAIYCGSATPPDPVYLETAREVGRTLAGWGIAIVYGGGRLGLMGAVAEAALDAGGTVIGVIPEALINRELAHRGLSELHVVPDMHARKALFASLSDGFLTLPGGVGTMDELWEAISWAQLGYHDKPVGLLNAAGFYDKLLDFNQHMIAAGFIRPAHAGILIARDTLPKLIEAMENYAPHAPITALPIDRL